MKKVKAYIAESYRETHATHAGSSNFMVACLRNYTAWRVVRIHADGTGVVVEDKLTRDAAYQAVAEYNDKLKNLLQ